MTWKVQVMLRVALHTLGCKVNQYETQSIAEAFLARGFELVDFLEQADIYVINSCTVTHTADSKSRHAARSALHRNPEAKVVLTGCYAETSPDEAKGIDGIALVVGNRDKAHLVDRVVDLLPEWEIPQRPISGAQHEAGRTRALVKVQDGCDQFCAYCAVPLARPAMWSKPVEEVLAEVEGLGEGGYREIVLTGIRLGRYGDGEKNLCHLLEALVEIPDIRRIRLSSIELTDIPDGLLDLMASNKKLCRHLHVPLQSGDDAVLARMNRPYTSSEFEAFVREAREKVPGIAITTDAMVGFPGETEVEFENTYSLMERVRFARSHIFRYSRRRGTAAESMKDDVPASEKTRRSERLMRLAAERSQEFAETLVGNNVEVLVEGKEVGDKTRSGLTDTYVRVVFDAGPDLSGKLVQVHVDHANRSAAHGRVVP